MIAIQVGGIKQYVQFTKQALVGVSAKNGSLLWQYDKPANVTANCATPVFGDDCVFAASDYSTGGGLVRLKKNRKNWEANEVYFTRDMNNHHGGMVLVDDCLYGCDDRVLRCLDFKTGKSLWQDRSCGKCSLVYADGLLYCRGEDGLVSLVVAKPEGFELKGRFEQPYRSEPTPGRIRSSRAVAFTCTTRTSCCATTYVALGTSNPDSSFCFQRWMEVRRCFSGSPGR